MWHWCRFSSKRRIWFHLESFIPTCGRSRRCVMAGLFGRFWVWKEPQYWDRWRALGKKAWSCFTLGLFRCKEFLLTRSWFSNICRRMGECQLSNHSAASIVLACALACLYLPDRSNLAVEASPVRQQLVNMVLILKVNWPRTSCALYLPSGGFPR